MCNCCVFVLPTLNPAPCTMCIIEFDIKIIILGKFSAEVSKIVLHKYNVGNVRVCERGRTTIRMVEWKYNYNADA